MTVFLVNSIKDNVTRALSFGEIRHVNIRYVYPDEIDTNDRMPADFTDAMTKACEDFDPRHDYLLIAGDHLQLVAFSAMLGVRHRSFRALRWDRQAEGYVPVLIEATP